MLFTTPNKDKNATNTVLWNVHETVQHFTKSFISEMLLRPFTPHLTGCKLLKPTLILNNGRKGKNVPLYPAHEGNYRNLFL